MNGYEYINEELTEAASLPLHIRKERKAQWKEMMQDIDAIKEETKRILEGLWGLPAMEVAHHSINTKRINEVARIGQLIAIKTCGCPDRESRAAWNELPQKAREAVNNAIKEIIAEMQEV